MASVVLLVEDEPLVAMTTEMMLEELGYEVLTAIDGPSAMALLELHGGNLDALVTDIRLPGIDGWAIARRAREIIPGLPVLYLSGDSGVEWSSNGVAGSVMLQKPFSEEHLAGELARLIAR